MSVISMDYVPESNKSSYVLEDNSGRQYVVSDATNGDVVHNGDKPYPEMTKEHLLRHSSKPFWRRLRMISIALIILCWIALIAATIAIIVVHPRCKEAPKVSWWQKSVIYRIYIRSFQDTNSKGFGDIDGVTSQLDYIKSLGVGAISLSPFYEHANTENEFSVLNHTSIHSDYGTMEDFQELVSAAHKKDIRVIIDFIPGTTSIDHTWFKRSSQDDQRGNRFRGYYVWEQGSTAPTNWLSVYSTQGDKRSAWTLNSSRNESYLHHFLEEQPDLNLRNPRVQKELEDILRFWLDAGVDGFYVRNSAYLFADFDLRDEQRNPDYPFNNTDDYDFYKHEYTFGLPEINDMFARWRHLVDNYANNGTDDRLLIADIRGDVQQTMSYFGRFGRDGVDFPLNYNLIPVNIDCDGDCVKRHTDKWLQNVPIGQWGTWMLGTEDTERLADKANGTLSRILMLMSVLLPGTPISYYGDEIGLEGAGNTPSNAWSMDQPMRSLMLWSNDSSGGFVVNCTGSCKTWLPIGDFNLTNVMFQMSEQDSVLSFYKNVTKLRENPTIQYGDFRYLITDSEIFSFKREFDGLTNYLLVVNFGSSEVSRDFTTVVDVTEATVVLATDKTYSPEDTVDLTSVKIQPKQGVVLSWDYQIKQY